MEDAKVANISNQSALYQWAREKLPYWQQVALSVLLDQSAFGSDVLPTLIDLCKNPDKRLEGELFPTDINTNQSSQSVSLLEVGTAEGVNALCSKQQLTFAESGLTIVFGYNGSGKSGYGRILRSACRARLADTPILGNVRERNPPSPSAEIRFLADGTEQDIFAWTADKTADPLLSQVSFFDSACARTHVGQRNAIAFTPFALDVLQRLSGVCDEVKGALEEELSQLEGQSPAFLTENDAAADGAVSALLTKLSARTKPEAVDQLAELSEQELDSFKSLNSWATQDPSIQAEQLSTRAERLDELVELLRPALTQLNDEAIAHYRTIDIDYRTKQAAADIAAQRSFDSEPVPGIGGKTWQHLWNAARVFALEAYPERDFPPVEQEDHCLLCLRPHDSESADRYQRFEQYVSDTTAVEARKAASLAKEAVASIEQLRLRLRGQRRKELFESLTPASKSDSDLVRRCVVAMLRRCRAIAAGYAEGQWSDELPVLSSPIRQLTALATAQRSEAKALSESADTPAIVAKRANLKAYQDRTWLSTISADVKAEITRLSQAAALKKAIKSCNTRRITQESKRIASDEVTNALRDAFDQEIKDLGRGVRNISVDMQLADGRKGTTYYQVGLMGAPKAKVADVVSEGEHRCVALAGFLAEVSMDDSQSAIVFDDPVSSLDHWWRGAFAQRIAREARYRQVVIFTHDLAFVNVLRDECNAAKSACMVKRIKTEQRQSGIVSDDLPWSSQRVQDQLDKHLQAIKPAKQLYDQGKDDEYDEAIGRYYGRLRATIERIVVEVFFANIVQRNREYVKVDPQLMARAAAVTQQDWDCVQRLHKRCCDITEAHDHSELRLHDPFPTPEKVREHWDQLDKLVRNVRKKQNDAVKSAGR